MFSVAAVREVDRRSVGEFGVPSIVLMENAARAVAEVALDLLSESDEPRVVILCGPGNNGGDGLAAARHLANSGVRVVIVLGVDPGSLAGDAGIHLKIVQKMGIPVMHARASFERQTIDAAIAELDSGVDMVIDALLGTGLSRPVDGVIAALITECNRLHEHGAMVLSVDVPSGLDAETGAPEPIKGRGSGGGGGGGKPPAIVEADVTLTLAGLKPGLVTEASGLYVGEIAVGDIGAPWSLLQELGKEVVPGAETGPGDDGRGDRGARGSGGNGGGGGSGGGGKGRRGRD